MDNLKCLKTLVQTLINGNQVQVKSLADGKWLNFRFSESKNCFECYFEKRWTPMALGGSGVLEWRYPPNEGACIA